VITKDKIRRYFWKEKFIVDSDLLEKMCGENVFLGLKEIRCTICGKKRRIDYFFYESKADRGREVHCPKCLLPYRVSSIFPQKKKVTCVMCDISFDCEPIPNIPRYMCDCGSRKFLITTEMKRKMMVNIL